MKIQQTLCDSAPLNFLRNCRAASVGISMGNECLILSTFLIRAFGTAKRF